MRNQLFFERLKLKTKPKTYFDELADYGILDEYLKKYYKQKYKTDDNFRNEIIESLINNSPDIIPEVECFFLEHLCETLSYFLEYTKQWKIQRQ